MLSRTAIAYIKKTPSQIKIITLLLTTNPLSSQLIITLDVTTNSHFKEIRSNHPITAALKKSFNYFNAGQ
jgi:hypothetical protein